MEPLYRQRLIGAMVLVAVAVVVVPLLLGEPRPVREGAGVEVQVPEPPRFDGPASPEEEAVVAMEAPTAFSGEDLAPPAPSAESLDAWLNPGSGEDATGGPPSGTAAAPPAAQVSEVDAATATATAAAPAAQAAPPAPGQVPATAAAAPPLAAVDATTSGSAAVGGVWVIQVGSFTDLDNARRRVEQLQSRAFEAWVAEPEQAGGPFRVWVGPELDRGRADELQARITRDLKLEAQVKRHVSH